MPHLQLWDISMLSLSAASRGKQVHKEAKIYMLKFYFNYLGDLYLIPLLKGGHNKNKIYNTFTILKHNPHTHAPTHPGRTAHRSIAWVKRCVFIRL